MQALFDKELIRMEQELRDLKTSHAIPVGSLNFYEHSGSATLSSGISVGLYVRITNDAGERAYPYVQVYVDEQSNADIVNYSQEQSIEQDGEIMQFYFSLVGNKTYNARVISTSAFSLIVKQYEDGDWIGE